MALTVDALKALQHYIEKCKNNGAQKETIFGAVVLTPTQREKIAEILSKYWNRATYACPTKLDIKPHHGYQSRVEKDGFLAEQYIEWLVAGCSDVAIVTEEITSQRPQLLVSAVSEDNVAISYDIVVPIRSDANGYIHIDGVIPKGLPPKKKQPPRRSS